MENSKNPAFAATERGYIQKGLTKREYFAAIAMQGIIASNQNLDLSIEEAKLVASQSLQFADELLKQLEQ